jgi:hypothetical protein
MRRDSAVSCCVALCQPQWCGVRCQSQCCVVLCRVVLCQPQWCGVLCWVLSCCVASAPVLCCVVWRQSQCWVVSGCVVLCGVSPRVVLRFPSLHLLAESASPPLLRAPLCLGAPGLRRLSRGWGALLPGVRAVLGETGRGRAPPLGETGRGRAGLGETVMALPGPRSRAGEGGLQSLRHHHHLLRRLLRPPPPLQADGLQGVREPTGVQGLPPPLYDPADPA